MHALRLLRIVLAISLLITAYACTDPDVKEKPAVFKQVPEIQEIMPQKPVKIKLKRNAKGNYAWDISGNNADEVLETDKKLKESFKND
ncbi:MAG TPA: hypothetical protein ENH31_02975 [Nitrospirae bacterium]|nr:hypothetical protein BMS3Abin10_01156 [bacterium BMS3Abin10]GBE38097.1 hypothetical protein BMS3Bbin08_00699 [bacterium BMS3Bbin08]HDH49813.1 hypothetical protein [Nitrospirota bacterium]HDK81516.1 hypothetical protein [Nitrospirota bacterium]